MFAEDLEDTRAIRRGITRARILDAAWELARRDRPTAVTRLREVARRVGMRAPSLYTYFGSKNAMYDAMYADGARQLAEILASRPRGQRSARDAAQPDAAAHRILRGQPGPVSDDLRTPGAGLRADARSPSRSLRPPWPAPAPTCQAAGDDGQAALDMFRALITGLVSLQVANDPGGDRWTRLQDDAFDMFFAHYADGRAPVPRSPPGKTREQPMATSSQPPAASTADAFDQSHQGRMRSAVVEADLPVRLRRGLPRRPRSRAPSTPPPPCSSPSAPCGSGPGHVVADLGCGHGGPGLWAARQTGATLIGIDLSPAGIELARRPRGAARPGPAGPLPGRRPDRDRPARCILRRRDEPGRAAVRPGQGRRRPRNRPDPAPGRPAGLHHLGTARAPSRR